MARILITGGGGFIASHLAKKLYDDGHFVRVADIKYDGYLKDRYYSQKCLLDLRILSNCLEAVIGVDYVYNLAANMGGIGYITSVNAEIMRDNVLINTNMLEAARIAGIKRYFYSSSACIYPNYKQTAADVAGLKESDDIPADPNEAYGWEKLFTEQMAMNYQKDYGLPVRIGRFHNIYGPCYDNKTEVLTRDGFKLFKDVDSDSEIATLNKETGYIEYHKPLAIQQYPFNGNMYHIAAKAIDLMVTPDHPLFFTTRRIKTNSHKPYKLEVAKEALEKPVLYMSRRASWHGDYDKVWICLPRVKYSDNRILHEKCGNKRRVRLSHWLRFLGWYLSEGSCVRTPRNYIVDISQKDETTRAQIADIISRMGFKPYIHPDGVRIFSKRLFTAVKIFGKAHDKYIPRSYLMLPPRRLRQLFECLMAGDGDKDGSRYSSVSKKLADDVAEIGIKLGYGVKTTFEDRPKPIYRVYFTKETTHKVLPEHVSKVEYKGLVYDVTVPNHIILVRRDGKVCWSGNCGTFEGGREKAPAALCRKVAKAKDGGVIDIWGDGTATRSFCYIDDCVRGVLALMESDYNKPINIGSDRLISINALADIIIGISGKKLTKEYIPSAPEGVKGRNADLTLVKQVLGWEPAVPLEVGLAETYKWIDKMVNGPD